MPRYRKHEAREWARANMTGCDNVIIPFYTGDLQALNEAGIRHDVRKCIEFGFGGSLLVSEVNVTLEEYRQFAEWARDEAKGRLRLVHHASFDTLEKNIEAVRLTEAAGADYVLLSYPASFYPTSMQDIYDYTKAFCDATNLAVMPFPVPRWNFGRLHPADIDPEVLVQHVKDVPNIVAIKAEGAMPSVGGLLDVHRRLHKQVIISCPIEAEVIPLMTMMEFQYSGTEYYGNVVPRMFNFARQGNMDAAMKLYWQIHPGRQAMQQVNAGTQFTLFLNRMAWKYHGWLQGMNGGPLRRPTNKIAERHMNTLRRGMVDSGLQPTSDPNSAFFVGRNPVPRARTIASRAAAE